MVKIPLVMLVVVITSATSYPTFAEERKSNGTFRFYHHEGEPVAQKPTRQPRIGAAHTISLNSELNIGISDAEREQIRALGPWLTPDGISDNAQVLIRTIQDARIHGLDPQAYELSKILKTIDLLGHLDRQTSATNSNGKSSTLDTALRDQLNSLLDTNFIKLAEHLGAGVVNGRKLQTRLYRNAPKVNAFNLLVSISSADLSVSRALSSVMPTHPVYLRLTHTMRNLLTELSTQVSRTRVYDSKPTGLISQAKDKQAIRERLLETGDLTFEAYSAPNPDAKYLDALRKFQTRHGLQASSFADKKTRRALNASVKQDIQAVALSLERWRWLPRDLGRRHVFVNIPDYTVKLVENGTTSLTVPAVVGTRKHQTPSFTRDMSYIEFNPTWTVPATITNTKLIPKERASSGYLISRNFDFLKRVGNRLIKVPSNSITREDFYLARFPYVLRQRSGPANALGRMKFMMPNQFAIYLHDTPSKKHFTLNDRAYSHGCIRLRDPETFAKTLMQGDGYSEHQVEKSLSSTSTHRIRLRDPLPTHLVYLTTWVGDDNLLQKRSDIYRNDEQLSIALTEASTLLSSLDEATHFMDDNSKVAQIRY